VGLLHSAMQLQAIVQNRQNILGQHNMLILNLKL
jgi:hypothetical protein